MSAWLNKRILFCFVLTVLSYAAMAQQVSDAPLGVGSARLANEAYTAFDKGNFAEAEQKAAMALKLRPDFSKLWLLRIYAIQRQGRHDAALSVAEEAVAANRDKTLLLKTRDSLRLEKSLRTTGSLRASAAATEKINAPVAVSREATSEQTPTRRVVIATQPSKSVLAWRNADMAYKSYSRGDYVSAMRYARRSIQLRPNQPEMKRLVRYADEKNRLHINAGVAKPTPPISPAGYKAATRAYAAWDSQDYTKSAHFGRIATEEAPGNAAYRILYINSLVLNDQYSEAHAQFSRLSAQSVTDSSLLDAAYTAQRLGENKKAVQWFSNALDKADAGRLSMDLETRENVKQTVSDLDTNWGVNSGVSYGSVGVMNPSFSPSINRRKTLQSAAELYWRSPWAGDGGGRHMELYVRGNMTHYDGTKGPTGISSLRSAAGIRVKPFSKQNVVIAAERLFKVGSNSHDDWLLRAAWSGGAGANPSPGKNASIYWQIYAEADYFIKQPQLLGIIEARFGRNYRVASINSNLSIAPHLSLNAGYDSLLARRLALGAGAGINIRYRFRDDKYHAPRSYVDLTVQYRVRVAGDDRSKGVFASLYFAY